MAHALGPLTRNTDLPLYFAPLLEAGGHPVCEVIPPSGGVDLDMQDNALRIMATWNACLDVDTADLWPGMVREMREALGSLTKSLRELIANSEGVAGLHLNGDVAPWDELLAGGRFEDWLKSLDEAEDVLRKARGEEVMPRSP